MGLSAQDIAWLVLLPMAYVSLLVALLSVLRYQRQLRSLDVFVLSFLAALILNLCFPVLIQLLLSLLDSPWTPRLCVLYVWAWDALRYVQILTLFALSLDRIFIFRNAGSYKFYGSKDKFYLTLVLWLFSGFLAVVPVAGWSTLDISSSSKCVFVASAVSMYYGLSFSVVIVWFMFMTLGCGMDALYNMQTFRVDALESLDHVAAEPSTLSRSTLQRRAFSANSLSRISTLQRVYRVSHPGLDDQKSVLSDATSIPPELLLPTPSSIETAYDNCKFALIAVMVSYAINHLPYVLMCLYGSLAFPGPAVLSDVAQWLVLLEALIWPHLLWVANQRYKKGYLFIWDVLRCKKKICEKDYGPGPGVRLQSFSIRQDEFSRDNRPSSFRLDTLDDVMRLSRGEPFMLGAMRRYHDNLAKRGVLEDQGGPNSSTDLNSSENNFDIPRQLRRGSGSGPSLQRSVSDVGYGSRGSTLRKSFPTGTPRRSVHADHVRSPHLSSRMKWKQRMREQFLPADYIEELERQAGATNPMYILHHGDNIPEEQDSYRRELGGRRDPPLAASLQTISSCDTMVIHNEEGSTMELDQMHPTEQPNQDLREMFSDAAIENAIAVREMNRAAISREAFAHSQGPPNPPSPAQSSNKSDSWEEIFVDAVSDVQIFYTQGSGSSDEDMWMARQDSFPTPIEQFHSLEGSDTALLTPQTEHGVILPKGETQEKHSGEPLREESSVLYNPNFVVDVRPPEPVLHNDPLQSTDTMGVYDPNLSDSNISDESHTHDKDKQHQSTSALWTASQDTLTDNDNQHQSTSALSEWTASQDTLTDNEFERFHSAADLLESVSPEPLDSVSQNAPIQGADEVADGDHITPVRQEGDKVDVNVEPNQDTTSDASNISTLDVNRTPDSARDEHVIKDCDSEINEMSGIEETETLHGSADEMTVSRTEEVINEGNEPQREESTEDQIDLTSTVLNEMPGMSSEERGENLQSHNESPKLNYSKII